MPDPVGIARGLTNYGDRDFALYLRRSFAKSMGEFGATITFVSNIPGETQTLPSAIYTFTQVPGGDVGALRLTIVSIIIAMAALLGSELMARRMNRRLDVE